MGDSLSFPALYLVPRGSFFAIFGSTTTFIFFLSISFFLSYFQLIMSSPSSYQYRADRHSKTKVFLHSVHLLRPLAPLDGTDEQRDAKRHSGDDPSIPINPTTITGTYIITIPKSGYEGPNNFDDPVALALAAQFFNECIARFKPFGYEGHWPPAYVESVTHQSRPAGHHPALRVEFTINPLYSPNAPYAFSGLHFVRHFLMEQGHSDNRFKSQPFWRDYRPAAHMKGIISSCLSRFTMIGGILLGLEPAHAGGDDFVGNVLQKHFFHVASERIQEKTSDDLTNVYRKYLIESKFFHQFGIVIDNVPCAAAYKEYTKRQFTKKFLLQIPQGSDSLTFDFLRWLCTRQDAATGEVEPWPLVIFGRKILFAPVPDPEHTSLEVFKEAGDVIHGAQTKTLEALQAPHAHSFSTVHIRDPLAVDVTERLCKLPGVITCGFPHQRKSQATVVRVFFASSVPNAPKSAEQFKQNIPHVIRAHIGFPQIYTIFTGAPSYRARAQAASTHSRRR